MNRTSIIAICLQLIHRWSIAFAVFAAHQIQIVQVYIQGTGIGPRSTQRCHFIRTRICIVRL